MSNLNLNRVGDNPDLTAIYTERNEKIKEYIDNHITNSPRTKTFYLELPEVLNPNIEGTTHVQGTHIREFDFHVQATDFKREDLISDSIGTIGIIEADYDPLVTSYNVRTISVSGKPVVPGVENIELGSDGDIITPVDGTATLPLANHAGVINPNLRQIEQHTIINNCHLELELIHMIRCGADTSTRSIQLFFSEGYSLILSCTSNETRINYIMLYLPNSSTIPLYTGSWRNSNYADEYVEYKDTVLTLTFNNNLRYENYTNSGFQQPDLNHILENIIIYGRTGTQVKGIVDPESDTIAIYDGKLEVPYAGVVDQKPIPLGQLDVNENMTGFYVNLEKFLELVLPMNLGNGAYLNLSFGGSSWDSDYTFYWPIQHDYETLFVSYQPNSNFKEYKLYDRGEFYEKIIETSYFRYDPVTKDLLLKGSTFYSYGYDKLSASQIKAIREQFMFTRVSTTFKGGIIKPKSNTIAIDHGALELSYANNQPEEKTAIKNMKNMDDLNFAYLDCAEIVDMMESIYTPQGNIGVEIEIDSWHIHYYMEAENPRYFDFDGNTIFEDGVFSENDMETQMARYVASEKKLYFKEDAMFGNLSIYSDDQTKEQFIKDNWIFYQGFHPKEGIIKPESNTITITDGKLEIKNIGWCSLGNITLSNADISLSFRDFRIYKYGDKNVYIPVIDMTNLIVYNDFTTLTTLTVDIDLETTTGNLSPRDILEYGSDYQLFTEGILRDTQDPNPSSHFIWITIWFISTSTIRFEMSGIQGFYINRDYSHSSMIPMSSSFNIPR